jgi:ectoine hydroxylase-related dioxygenase (phytanoyl-CoA dioxygenase family)
LEPFSFLPHLPNLRATIDIVNRRHAAELDELGYTVLPSFMSTGLLAQLRCRVDALFEEEGDRAGAEFKLEPGARRLANLVDKGEVFRRSIADRTILDYIAKVLGAEFKLSSLNARSANPHNGVGQPLHADMGAIADERGYWVCNTVWLLDDFTEDNGALRVVPGSHRWGKLPQQVLADPAAAHPDELLLTGRAGDVFVMNAHMWHGGTENRTDSQRRAMHAFYCRRDKPQQQYQKQLLREETQRACTPQQRAILALDDPLNDELAGSPIPRSGFMK